MGLRTAVTSWALARPRVLVVDSPEARALRWAAETELDHRRWPAALSPADADVLLVLGDPGPGLAAAVELLWSQLPAPRLRVQVRTPGALADSLTGAATRLAASGADPAPGDPWQAAPRPDEHGADGMNGMDHGGMDHGDHGDMDHGEHMHHGGEVAGLPMAQTAADRDGLELDSLAVTVGPWLPAWPTGLVVHGRLQGDVLTEPHVTWVDPDAALPPAASPQVVAADVLSRLLVVAGWPLAALEARRTRADLLAGAAGAGARAHRLARRVTRSRVLTWSLRGIGCDEQGRDAAERVRRWAGSLTEDGDPPPPASPQAVAAMTDGAELAALRLAVSTLDPSPAAASGVPAGRHEGHHRHEGHGGHEGHSHG
ncbi:hypothetical protein HJG43_14270 [Kineosporiaceae bacterium SCSIO 59966]|nr:hypothetical protein HJG43_14270 [Kineosporiaceae bacterium SCSIO 59966]